MNKEEKIKVIYKKIANWYECDIENCKEGKYQTNRYYEPCLIGDVLEYFEQENYVSSNEIGILADWSKKRFPIEEQSEECIDYIFNLIK